MPRQRIHLPVYTTDKHVRRPRNLASRMDYSTRKTTGKDPRSEIKKVAATAAEIFSTLLPNINK